MNFSTNKIAPTGRKLRGGYYTPVSLAEYICDWAVREGGERVLEPSAGDGNFVVALNEAVAGKGFGKPASVTAVELDAEEMLKGCARTAALPGIDAEWLGEDFFEAYPKLRRDFDIIVGNPPFIRFQYFDAIRRDRAFNHLRRHGYRPTKLANAWAAFVQLAMELLRPGGRLAMVVPAEILQVKYAAELRERLTQIFDRIVLVTFRRLVFDGVQQEVVLLLAEGKRKEAAGHSLIQTVELEDTDELCRMRSLADTIEHVPEKHARNNVKWTALFLSDRAFANLERAYRSDNILALGQLADVDVGIVTGRNSFFAVDRDRAERLQLNGFSQRLVGRTSSLRSIFFDSRDYAAHSERHSSVLIDLNGIEEEEFSPALAKYIEQGEAAGVNSGYKCRIRRRWYDIPSSYVPDAFLFRQIHDAPLLVANEAGATSTDTIHRVRLKRELSPRRLSAAFCNSLTFAWAEICGRSYGGGVLELEPREAEELPIPLEAAAAVDERKVDRLVRENGVEAALDYTDPILLGRGLRISPSKIDDIRACWVLLRDRRKNRRRVRKAPPSSLSAGLQGRRYG